MKLFITLILLTLSLYANQRVVSLSPSITEILFALNAGDEVVATSSYSLYPPKAKTLPIVGNYSNPNIEKILSHRPTLVVGQTFNSNTLEKLKHFKIKTLTLQLRTINEIKNSITKLAIAINRPKNAAKLLQNITNAAKNAAISKDTHSVMIVYGLKEDLSSGIYIAGNEIFFNDIIKLCHNTNAYTDDATSQPVLNYENIIALNPDQIIILHSHATEPNVDVKKALQNWYDLPTNASKNRHISIVDEDYLHIPSHRVALTIERLSREMR